MFGENNVLRRSGPPVDVTVMSVRRVGRFIIWVNLFCPVVVRLDSVASPGVGERVPTRVPVSSRPRSNGVLLRARRSTFETRTGVVRVFLFLPEIRTGNDRRNSVVNEPNKCNVAAASSLTHDRPVSRSNSVRSVPKSSRDFRPPYGKRVYDNSGKAADVKGYRTPAPRISYRYSWHASGQVRRV